MKKKKIIILIMLFSTLLSIPKVAYASPENYRNDIIEENKNNISEEDRKEIDKVIEKITKLDNKIETSMIKTEQLKEQIEKNEKEIEDTDKLIEEKKKELQEKQDILDVRLRKTYSEGYFNTWMKYAELIFTSNTINSLFSRIDGIIKITNSDKLIIGNIKSMKKELEEKNQKLEEDKITLDRDKKDLEENIDTLNKSKEEEEKILNKKYKNLLEKMSKSNPIPEDVDYNLPDMSKEGIQKVQDVIKESYKYLNVPYVWGGTTPKGFDCSGYMQYIFNKVGISLPRVSQDQQQVGIEVPKGSLQPGDLIFWGYPAHHVGMYIGNGEYIQAPHTGDVIKISKLSQYTNAKRVIS